MSGLARVLLSRGYRVSGSDMKENFWTRKLEQLGAGIYHSHKKEHITKDCHAVVISTAIQDQNPELSEARTLGIPVLHRSQMLNMLVKDRQLLSIAGTHGKTTTSSMLTAVYQRNNLDPVVFIGGEFDEIQGNAKDGAGPGAIIEADESDGSFLNYSPYASIITNIDEDHLDFYQSFKRIQEYFLEYIKNHHKEGFIVLCGDDAGISDLQKNIAMCNRKVHYYGRNEKNDFIIRNINMQNQPTRFDIYNKEQEHLGSLSLLVPGLHNVYNATAVFALSYLHKHLKPQQIADALSCFRGAQRRFQVKGIMNDIMIIDDYGHHPTEVKATIESAVQLNNSRNGRLIVIFQPHRYSRTQYFLNEFARCFEGVDMLYLMDIYSAGEEAIPGIDSHLLFRKIQDISRAPQELIFSASHMDTVKQIYDSIMPGDTVISIGAGDVYKVGEEIFDKLREK